MKNRIGVYICHCGSNISDTVDVQRVRSEVGSMESVEIAKTTMFACADSTQKEIVRDIKDHDLDALVVASCSPKLHLHTFRNVAIRAGINPYNYVQVNIREQCSWPHSYQKEEATKKAIALVRAGIKRAVLSQSLEPPRIPAKNAVAVIGAGISGMRASLELADNGTQVYLLEKDHFVGGRMVQWEKVFPGDKSSHPMITTLYYRLVNHEKIQLITGAEIISNSGSIGNFNVKVRIHPRYISKDSALYNRQIEQAIDVCPEKKADPYNFGLTQRKAIYQPKQGQYPQLPVIDMDLCSGCGRCEEITPLIELNQEIETLNIEVGAIIVCTGFDPYEPEKGEFGYTEHENVITLPQFKRMLEQSNGTLLNGSMDVRNIAYIYCVGSRQIEGNNKYCSRYCCTSAIHTALLVKEKYPDVTNFHINRGIRTYGKQEILYQKSSEQGDVYLQTAAEDPPEIVVEEERTVVKINDLLTAGKSLELDADLIVLVTGMEPRKENGVADIFKVPVGRDGFFNEVHPKLRPVETVIDGVYIAGTCQAPYNIAESVKSALSAAIKAHNTISAEEITLEPTLARVNSELCTWCGACQEACPFDAISKLSENGKLIAKVHQSNCKGCGMCLPVCEQNAIDLDGFTDSEIESMIDVLSLAE